MFAKLTISQNSLSSFHPVELYQFDLSLPSHKSHFRNLAHRDILDTNQSYFVTLSRGLPNNQVAWPSRIYLLQYSNPTNKRRSLLPSTSPCRHGQCLKILQFSLLTDVRLVVPFRYEKFRTQDFCTQHRDWRQVTGPGEMANASRPKNSSANNDTSSSSTQVRKGFHTQFRNWRCTTEAPQDQRADVPKETQFRTNFTSDTLRNGQCTTILQISLLTEVPLVVPYPIRKGVRTNVAIEDKLEKPPDNPRATAPKESQLRTKFTSQTPGRMATAWRVQEFSLPP